jgi:hypothetical protein
LIARNATGCSSIFATASAAKGTEPINKVGRSFITSRISNFQQSPTVGRDPTSATSLHQRLTPASSRPAPSSSKIEVTLGASETILIRLEVLRAMMKAILRPRTVNQETQPSKKNAPESITPRRVEFDRQRQKS